MDERTTIAIQRYLDDLNGRGEGSLAEPIVRDLLGRAAQRLHLLCASLLHRSYPRLTRPPVNMQATEMLSAVIERMLKALREARPGTVRQFFYIAGQHMRWELNDVARRLDQGGTALELRAEFVAPPAESDSTIGPNAVRMLEAIEDLPVEEREVFDLLRIHEMTQPEAAELLGVSVRTVQRRLSSSILLLTEELADLYPQESKRADLNEPPDETRRDVPVA
jgi:RNA polymerase sigma factor (sigma-70 family)